MLPAEDQEINNFIRASDQTEMHFSSQCQNQRCIAISSSLTQIGPVMRDGPLIGQFSNRDFTVYIEYIIGFIGIVSYRIMYYTFVHSLRSIHCCLLPFIPNMYRMTIVSIWFYTFHIHIAAPQQLYLYVYLKRWVLRWYHIHTLYSIQYTPNTHTAQTLHSLCDS